MELKNTTTRYGLVAITLHWLLALIVITLLCVGLYMTSLKTSPEKLKLYGLHKEFGIVVLTLVIIRVLWRFFNITPKLTIPRWERNAALAVHWTLYILMLAMPLTGWLMSSAAGFPVSFFGLFTLPNLIAPNDYLRDFFAQTHEVLSNVLIALIVLHLFAALKHHFYDKDDTIRRMLP
ncbi:cytochrome b561 transmembrane protein [Legionella beliardensis]|uniref:Cytochrome b561 transmembrane protein n=1 Tax=Legionella beliardensis TaxID=91822 RepID=A0A378HZD8_9GAMM|nr:cytochrome b [Legionella beliardensis]STX28113.1 cytochrome b561 transmembrane protein [Legionella beliardensis]